MRAATAFVLALMVALAGCSGLPGAGETSTPGEGATPAGTPTATPTDDSTSDRTPMDEGTPTRTDEGTPTDEATPVPDETLSELSLPPGVSADGVDDATALVEAHAGNLQASGAVTRLETTTESDATEVTANTTVRIGSDDTFSVVQRSDAGLGSTVSRTYVDDAQVSLNQSVQGQTIYSSFSSEYYRSIALPETNLDRHLDLLSFEVASVDRREDGTRLTLRAVGPAESAFGGGNATVGNVSGSLVVDLEGTIHSLSLYYEVSAAGSTSSVDVEYAVERRGVQTVESPDWTETASERSVSADLSVTVEDDVVVIRHEGGDALPSGTQVSVLGTAVVERRVGANESVTLFSARLEESFEPGDTAYVYQTEEGSLTGTATTGERPDVDAAPLDEDLLVQLVDGHAGETIDVTRVRADEDDS